MSARAMADVWKHAPDDWDPYLRFVALTLADHMSREGAAFPSLARLEKLTGLRERTLRRRLRALEEAGWITRHERFLEDGTQIPNLYRWTGPSR